MPYLKEEDHVKLFQIRQYGLIMLVIGQKLKIAEKCIKIQAAVEKPMYIVQSVTEAYALITLIIVPKTFIPNKSKIIK